MWGTPCFRVLRYWRLIRCSKPGSGSSASRNDRVLVLCPKRLRDNWTLYRANDRRNFIAGDRFNYDSGRSLNHTDLSRDGGLSGDIDLSHVNWGHYDLVVIDESHNFRNKRTPRQGGETRYDRLMRRIIREGVKTRVLVQRQLLFPLTTIRIPV